MLQAAFFSFWRKRNRMILSRCQSNPNFAGSEGALRLAAAGRVKEKQKRLEQVKQWKAE